MASMTMLAAIRETLLDEMARDERVVLLGEDVGKNGGVFRATDGALERFGEWRVFDTPLAESTIVGASIGLSVAGLVPVAEIQFGGFTMQAYHQLVGQLARFRYRSRSRYHCPVTVRSAYGGGVRTPEHHNDSVEAPYTHAPGLSVVVPSTAADAKGLMATAIRDDNPVVYLHNYLLTLEHGEVPDGEYLVPFGEAAIRREGGDVTIVATGWCVDRALNAAEELAKEGIQAEVIDPRTLAPLDTKTILESVEKTGRLVLVDQSTRHASAATVIAGEVAEHGFSSLKAPIIQVTALDATVPYSQPLEAFVMPDESKVVAAVRQVLGLAPVTA